MKKGYSVSKLKENENIQYNYNIYNNFKLYRYRSVNEYTLSALINNEIWGSTPTQFNDPYDSKYFYTDKKDLDKIINIWMSNYKDNLKGVKIDNNEVYRMICKGFTEQSFSYISCFSEKINSEIMWAHYADYAKGFAIEYKYEDLHALFKKISSQYIEDNKLFFSNMGINDDDITTYIYRCIANLNDYGVLPIIYKSQRINLYAKINIEQFQEFYIKMFEIQRKGGNFAEICKLWHEFFSDKAFMKLNNMINTLKCKEWQYEKEWRLCCPMTQYELVKGINFKLMGNLKPNAIYLGERIPSESKNIIMEIARSKEVPLYQMYIDFTKKRNQLCYEKVKND